MTSGVVILTHNQPDQLQKILGGLGRQTIKPDQIAVVDDNSDQKYGKLPKQVQYRKLKYKDTPDRRSEARNIGAQMLNTDVMLFLDGDIVPTSRVIESAMSHFSNPGNIRNVVTGPKQDVNLDPNCPDDTHMMEPGDMCGDPSESNYEDAASYGFACTKPFFDYMGGFDPNYRGWGWEDTDLFYRMIGQGGKIISDPRAQFNHIYHPTNFADTNKLLNIVKNATYMLQKHKGDPQFLQFALSRLMELGMLAEYSRMYGENDNGVTFPDRVRTQEEAQGNIDKKDQNLKGGQ